MACGVRQALSRTAVILILAISVYGILLVVVSNSSSTLMVISKVKSISNGIHTRNATSIERLDDQENMNNIYLRNPNDSISNHSHESQGVLLSTSYHEDSFTRTSRDVESDVQGTASQEVQDNTTMSEEPSPHPVLVTSAGIQSGFTLLTLFTTFKSLPSKVHIYKNTIKNWQLLIPYVQPVLYYIPGELDLVPFAKDHGWAVHEVPHSNANNVPILRSMFLNAQERYLTPYYGYANGDILFNMSLVQTLKAFQAYRAKLDRVLIVGRRSNYKLSSQQDISSLDEVTKFANNSKLFGTNAQDYFISTFNGYPWESIPDFVVGRVGYDNWLVVTAISRGMKVIDTTNTLLALHQTGHDGDFAGHSNKEKKGDVGHNYKLAGMSFNYNMGHVTCSQFLTAYNSTGAIEIVKREKNICLGMYRRRRLNPFINLKR